MPSLNPPRTSSISWGGKQHFRIKASGDNRTDADKSGKNQWRKNTHTESQSVVKIVFSQKCAWGIEMILSCFCIHRVCSQYQTKCSSFLLCFLYNYSANNRKYGSDITKRMRVDFPDRSYTLPCLFYVENSLYCDIHCQDMTWPTVYIGIQNARRIITLNFCCNCTRQQNIFSGPTTNYEKQNKYIYFPGFHLYVWHIGPQAWEEFLEKKGKQGQLGQ